MTSAGVTAWAADGWSIGLAGWLAGPPDISAMRWLVKPLQTSNCRVRTSSKATSRALPELPHRLPARPSVCSYLANSSTANTAAAANPSLPCTPE